MTKCILVPVAMREFLKRAVEAHAGEHHAADAVLAVLSTHPVEIPLEYEFTTSEGDRCRTIAWSEEEARRQVREDRRFPGELHLQGTAPAWPGTGVSRVICPDEVTRRDW